MLRVEGWLDVHVLTKAGKKMLAMEVAQAAGRRHRPRGSTLGPCVAYLQDRYSPTWLSAVRMHEEIAVQGYIGGVDMARRYVRTLVPITYCNGAFS